MGHAKRMMEEGSLATAWNHHVCAGCFSNPAIKKFIAGNAAADERCGFCDGAGHEPVAWLRDVMGFMLEGIHREYTDPVNVSPWVEGEYLYPTVDSRELLFDVLGLGLPRDEEGRLEDLLVRALSDWTWCERDYAILSPSQHLLSSSEKFRELVSHGRRFFFHDHDYPEDPDREHPDHPLSPRQVLERVLAYAEQTSLVRELPAGTKLYRAREERQPGEYQTAEVLGPPPPEKARANRMSPSGVPMFYCALDAETAVAETPSTSGLHALAEFETTAPIRILDLSKMPPLPSIFDPERAELREAIRFLHEFAVEISKPYPREDHELVEYVPTQVITEYVRFIWDPAGGPVDGVCFASSRRPGGRNVVLFPPAKGGLPRSLGLKSVTDVRSGRSRRLKSGNGRGTRRLRSGANRRTPRARRKK